MDISGRLLELYGIRNELEQKYFDFGVGKEQIREINEDIAYLESRAPKGWSEIDPLLVLSTNAAQASEGAAVIHIDKVKGIYIDDARKYGIAGKRREFIWKLLESDSLTAEDLEEFWSTSSQIANEIKEINVLTRKNLGIEHDIITHSKSARTYSLNREKLDIEPS